MGAVKSIGGIGFPSHTWPSRCAAKKGIFARNRWDKKICVRWGGAIVFIGQTAAVGAQSCMQEKTVSSSPVKLSFVPFSCIARK